MCAFKKQNSRGECTENYLPTTSDDIMTDNIYNSNTKVYCIKGKCIELWMV